MSCGIYKITNKINQHSYIGQSINIERRWNDHKRVRTNKEMEHYPLYRAFAKYGINNFDFSIIELCSQEELDEKEKFYIEQYDTYNNGYNQTLGGSGSVKSVKLSSEEIFQIYDLLLNSTLSQREIAKIFMVGEDTISEINQGKTRINKNLIYPLRQNKTINTCKRCGKQILKASTYCKTCNSFFKRKIKRPTREELKQKIRIMPFIQIAKEFGVSNNAIKKWCILEKLPSRKSDINQYSDEEWKNI